MYLSQNNQTITSTIPGADLELGRENGWLPIHAAAYGDFEQITKLLVESGACLSSQNSEIRQYSALHIAISVQHPPMILIQTLVCKGAPLNLQVKDHLEILSNAIQLLGYKWRNSTSFGKLLGTL